ncbi:hypothetical protein GCM10022241_05180 [Micrococcus endophyticus]
MLPRPTAEPIAARMNAHRPANSSRVRVGAAAGAETVLDMQDLRRSGECKCDGGHNTPVPGSVGGCVREEAPAGGGPVAGQAPGMQSPEGTVALMPGAAATAGAIESALSA